MTRATASAALFSHTVWGVRHRPFKSLVNRALPLLPLAGLGACGGGSTAPTTTAVPTTTVPPTTTTTIPLVCGTHAVTGPESQMDWGAKSFGTVTATGYFEADGTLCGATADWWAELLISEEITAEAVPVLNARATKAHAADVNAVSGATATSNAYRTSLQAAIDAEKNAD